MLTTLGVVFDTPRLPIFDDMMNSFSIVSFDFIKMTPLGCFFPMNFHIGLVLRTAVPLAIVTALAGVHACNSRRLRWLEQRKGDEAVAKARAGRLTYFSESGLTAAFFLIFLIYPSTSTAVLSFFLSLIHI